MQVFYFCRMIGLSQIESSLGELFEIISRLNDLERVGVIIGSFNHCKQGS